MKFRTLNPGTSGARLSSAAAGPSQQALENFGISPRWQALRLGTAALRFMGGFVNLHRHCIPTTGLRVNEQQGCVCPAKDGIVFRDPAE